MKLAWLAFGLLCLVLPTLTSASAAPPLACAINHSLLPDQHVTYAGHATATVGVRFEGGSPLCHVQVVCWGEVGSAAFICTLPPLP